MSSFGKVIAISGLAFTLLGVAIFRKKMKSAATGALLMAKEQWQKEKINVVKDKEMLEEKVSELESILERMARDIDSLTSSLKDKQNIISAQESEKEKNKQQERKNKKDFSDQIELLTRRAQQYLKQLEDKTTLCDNQHELLSNMEYTKERLTKENKELEKNLKKSEEALRTQQREFIQDLQYLLSHHMALASQREKTNEDQDNHVDGENMKEHLHKDGSNPLLQDWPRIIDWCTKDSGLMNILEKWKPLLLPTTSQLNA